MTSSPTEATPATPAQAAAVPGRTRVVSTARTTTGPLTFVQLQASLRTDIRQLGRTSRRLMNEQHNPVTVRRLYDDDTDDFL